MDSTQARSFRLEQQKRGLLQQQEKKLLVSRYIRRRPQRDLVAHRSKKTLGKV